MVFRFIFKSLAAILVAFSVFAVVAIFGVVLLRLVQDAIAALYAQFPVAPSARYQTFASIAATCVAILGVGVALLTFYLNNRANRRAQRKQHTISILLETRLSDRFSTLNTQRRLHFPEYHDITFADWDAARTAITRPVPGVTHDMAQAQVDSAHAVTSLLNYYEFLAVGIAQGDLDALLLKKTLRGIMCNLVDDCRDLIAGMRLTNDQTYQNLAVLYDQWRRRDSVDINGNPNERPIPDLRRERD